MSVAALSRPTMRARLSGPLASAIDFLRLLSRKPLGLVGLFGVIFFAVLAYIVPFFVPSRVLKSTRAFRNSNLLASRRMKAVSA